MSFYIIHVNDGTAVKTSRFFIITNKTWDTSIYFYYYFKFEIQKKECIICIKTIPKLGDT